MIKKYKEFNESLRDAMKPKSIEDVISAIKNESGIRKLVEIERNNLWDIFKNDEVVQDYNKFKKFYVEFIIIVENNYYNEETEELEEDGDTLYYDIMGNVKELIFKYKFTMEDLKTVMKTFPEDIDGFLETFIEPIINGDEQIN